MEIRTVAKAIASRWNLARHIGNATLDRNLRETLKDDLDRTMITARDMDGEGRRWRKPE